VQDEITEAVTIAIAPAIAAAEQQRAMRKPPGSLDAWGAYQRGLWHLSKASAEENALAEKFFQRAIDLDPIFAGGYTGLAAAINRAGVMFLTRNLEEALSAEEALARRAVALDGDDAEARSRLAIALQSRGDYQGGQAESRARLGDQSYRVLAAALGQLGRTAEAKQALEQAIAIAPAHVAADIRERLPGVRPEDHAHMLDGLHKAGWRDD